MPRDPIRVSIVMLPHASAASIYCAHDDLAAVGRLEAGLGLASPHPGPGFSVRTIAASRDPIEGAAGIQLVPQKSLEDVRDTQLVFVPALVPHPAWTGKCGEVPVFDPAITAWIAERYAAGATIVSLCTGSFVLAEAGLLDGLPATTHWALAELMQARFPRIDVQARRPIVVTGQEGRLVVAGTGTYHSDVMLLLVHRFLGREAAHHVARVSGKFWAGEATDVYARVFERANLADALVREAQAWLAQNLTVAEPVKALASRFHQTERTLSRRFREAIGVSPLAYLQALRVERARQLLEATRLPVTEVAERVGYADVGHFRRVFRREAGLAPGDYRKRFKLPPEHLFDSDTLPPRALG